LLNIIPNFEVRKG